MGLKTTNLKSWSVQKYVIAVLWMEGRLGTEEIARQVKWTGGQVRGFYTREFDPPRVNMTRLERQGVLDGLKASRQWFGVFIEERFDDRFRAKEIASERLARLRQEAALRAEAEPAKLSKRDVRRLQQEAEHKSRQEAQDRAQRELGFAPRGRETDALEWLALHSLGDKREDAPAGALMSRDRRKEALLKFRVHTEGASISPLRAQDYEATRGAGVRLALPEFRKHCIDMLGGARSVLLPVIYQMLDRIVNQDDFFWLRAENTRAKGQVFEAIRYGADILAVYYGIIAPHEFKSKWNEEPPKADLPTRSAARADSARAQEIIDELTKAAA